MAYCSSDSIPAFCTSIQQAAAQNRLAPGWRILLHQKLPGQGQRLSALLENHRGARGTASQDRESDLQLVQKLAAAEEEFFTDRDNPLFGWNQETVCHQLAVNFAVACQPHQITLQRSLSHAEIMRWLHPEHSAYGHHLAQRLSPQELEQVTKLLLTIAQSPVAWNQQAAYFIIQEN